MAHAYDPVYTDYDAYIASLAAKEESLKEPPLEPDEIEEAEQR